MKIIKDAKVSTMLECTSNKHRMVIDVSFDRPVTSEYAKLYIESAIHRLKTSEPEFKRYNFDEMS